MERVKKGAAAIVALAAGVANALFGGGGGMLVVPAFTQLMAFEEKRAHSTAIAVMLPLSLVSAVVYTLRGVGNPLVFSVGGGAVVGGAVGALLLAKIPKGVLSFVFYGIMIYAGIRCLG